MDKSLHNELYNESHFGHYLQSKTNYHTHTQTHAISCTLKEKTAWLVMEMKPTELSVEKDEKRG